MPKSVIAQYTEISPKVTSVGVRFSVVAKFFCDYVFIRFTNCSYRFNTAKAGGVWTAWAGKTERKSASSIAMAWVAIRYIKSGW